LNPRLSAVRNMAALVETFGEANKLSMRTNFVVNLALEELITNAVIHGRYEKETEPKIQILLVIREGWLVVVMQTNGEKFDPTVDTTPDISSNLEDRSVGGLGLYFVKAQADRISYDYVDGTNCLTLQYKLP